jgi:cardiolipin synthase
MNFRTLFLCLLITVLTAGCATNLPDVKSLMGDLPAADPPPEIIGAHGPLSTQKSAEIMDRLKAQGEPTEILGRHMTAMEQVSRSPLVEGNTAALLLDGPAAYAAAVKAIEGARDNINWETYILDDGKAGDGLADLLLRKRAGGVQVNIIYDSFGSLRTSASFFRRLRRGGINTLEFSPLNPFRSREKWRPIYRDHRKVLIVDGKTAITGGINISREAPGPGGRDKERKIWRDTDVEIEGPAVSEFQKLFLDTWQRQKGPKLPDRKYFPPLKDEGDDLIRVVGSTPGDWNRITFIMYVSAFTSAKKSIHITNAYFVPDGQMVEALAAAAERGVDVEIILPDSSDFNMIFYAGRHYYSQLLKAGVRLYERQKRFLHAKTAVIDGVWSTVGSTNMDYWSSAHNDEENAVIVGRGFASQMEAVFARDLAESKEILPGEWEKRSSLVRLREWFFHLFAPML